MKSTAPRPLGKTLLVLGAGATVGSTLSSFDDRASPPLDSDFFTQIQRIKSPKHLPYVDALIKHCFREFGQGWSMTMEQFFNYIWYADYFRESELVKVAVGKKSLEISVELLFRQVLLGILEESLFGAHSQNCKDLCCRYHDELAQHLEERDSIISFNYDCLIDASLVNHCPFWNPRVSYGFSPIDDGGLKYWSRDVSRVRGCVKLLKLHGSINWKRQGGGIKLLSRPYTRQNGHRDFYIIPPVLSKESEIADELWSVWEMSYKELQRAETIIVIGYSLPASDALANALFAARMHGSPKSKPLNELIIVNPDRPTRRHVMRAFRKSIDESSSIMMFDRLADLNKYLFGGEMELR